MVLPCGLVCTRGSLLAAPPTAAWVPVNTLRDPFLEGSFLVLRCFKCPYFLDGTAMLGCPPWLPLSLLLYCEILRKEGSLLFSLYPSTPFPLQIIWNTLWVI